MPFFISTHRRKFALQDALNVQRLAAVLMTLKKSYGSVFRPTITNQSQLSISIRKRVKLLRLTELRMSTQYGSLQRLVLKKSSLTLQKKLLCLETLRLFSYLVDQQVAKVPNVTTLRRNSDTLIFLLVISSVMKLKKAHLKEK